MAKGPYTSNLLTRRDVERVFQLSPEPPAMAALNGYILAAKSTGDNNFFSSSCTTMRNNSTAAFTVFCKATVPINMTRSVS